MTSATKRNVLGVLVDAVTYESAIERIVAAAREARPLTVSALAVHGVMTGVNDPVHRTRLNALDLVTPDGQPVRWALNALYGCGLGDRVYGPTLTHRLCAAAARHGLPVYFYGSRPDVLERLVANLTRTFPGLRIAGTEPSKFRRTTASEKEATIDRIRASGARLVFVGLGCPRQEVFVYEYGPSLGVPTLAVGAAFDFHAGLLREPPAWMQRSGLQWLHRLLQEPRRLWRRYLVFNSQFVALFALQYLRLWQPRTDAGARPVEDVGFG